MITYKLFRIKKGKLYPLFVDANAEMQLNTWLHAKVGDLYDATHVKSKLGALSLRPGFHSTKVPFTDWIGKKGKDGKLYQKPDTVWCECEVSGDEVVVANKNGLRTLPNGWYYFKTKAKQPFPWIISDCICIKRILTYDEVEKICCENGVHAQPLFAE